MSSLFREKGIESQFIGTFLWSLNRLPRREPGGGAFHPAGRTPGLELVILASFANPVSKGVSKRRSFK